MHKNKSLDKSLLDHDLLLLLGKEDGYYLKEILTLLDVNSGNLEEVKKLIATIRENGDAYFNFKALLTIVENIHNKKIDKTALNAALLLSIAENAKKDARIAFDALWSFAKTANDSSLNKAILNLDLLISLSKTVREKMFISIRLLEKLTRETDKHGIILPVKILTRYISYSEILEDDSIQYQIIMTSEGALRYLTTLIESIDSETVHAHNINSQSEQLAFKIIEYDFNPEIHRLS